MADLTTEQVEAIEWLTQRLHDSPIHGISTATVTIDRLRHLSAALERVAPVLTEEQALARDVLTVEHVPVENHYPVSGKVETACAVCGDSWPCDVRHVLDVMFALTEGA